MDSKEKKVLNFAYQQRQRLFDTLARLINFDTQNLRNDGREKECAQYMYGLYKEMGLQAILYNPDDLPGFTAHPDYLPGRNTQDRPNAEAIWPGLDPDLAGQAIMLAAHTDTMPVGERDRWSFDPFGGQISKGRIYGLGAGDNKSGLAAAVFAVYVLQECGLRLQKPLILSAYCDEEYGGGNGALAACLNNEAETIINLDGGNYEIWTIAPGGCGYRIHLHKTSSTDSLMDIYLATQLLMEELQVFAARRRKELHQIPLYVSSDMERSAFRLSTLRSADNSHNDLTLSFVIYTVKDQAGIQAELTDILTRLAPEFARYQIKTDGFVPSTRFFHYGNTDKSNGAFSALQQAASDSIGYPVAEKGSCLTDLSLFLKYGSPHSINFGILRDFALPGGAHQPDEYVDCDQFIAYAQALILFLLRFGGIADNF